MSDSKQSDHWDLLASVLGTALLKSEPSETAPQAEEKMPDIDENTDMQASAGQTPDEPAEVHPASPLSSWDALAMELGIEVKSDPPPPPHAPSQLPNAKKAGKRAVISAEHPRESSGREAEEIAKQPELLETSKTSSAEESEEPGEKNSRHRRRRHRKGKDNDRPIDEMKKSPSVLGRKASAEGDLKLFEIPIETADKAGIEIEEDSEEDEAEKQRQKRRRSHRGLRKRKKKGAETTREESSDIKKSGASGRAESIASAELHQASADDVEIAEEEHEESGQRGVKSPFRAIPTWEEAVGCIVAKNMESRPKRQGNGPPRSRGDSHKRRRK